MVSGVKICQSSEKDEKSPALVSQTIEQLRTEINKTKQVLQEVRRDQLNYRIEKDLLKETYSSNVQTINIVIALILGILTVVGFFGVRSIDAIKKEFQKELNELRGLRKQYEQKFADIEAEQVHTEKEFEDLRATSEEQNKRLKILEIQEKAGSLMATKDFSRALEYLSVGLELGPDDVIMLRQKLYCYIKLYKFPEAMECGELLLKNEPSNMDAASELAELYLIEKKIPEYERLVEINREALIRRYSEYLLWFFELVKLYTKEDFDSFVIPFQDELIKEDSEKSEKIRGGWVFDEVKSVFGNDEETPQKSLLWKSIDFLEGKINESELKAAVEEVSPKE